MPLSSTKKVVIVKKKITNEDQLRDNKNNVNTCCTITIFLQDDFKNGNFHENGGFTCHKSVLKIH